MNCERFQNWVYEYVEGSLSAKARAAAERHLAHCGACRQAVRREQHFERLLSERLRHDTETLALRPDALRRILKAVEAESTPPSPSKLYQFSQIIGSFFGRARLRRAVTFSHEIASGFDGYRTTQERPALRAVPPYQRTEHVGEMVLTIGFCRRFAWQLGMVVVLLLIAGLLVFHPFSGAQVHETEAVRSNNQANPSAVSIQVSYLVPVHKFREEGNFVVDALSYQTVTANETLWAGAHAALREIKEN
jgi:anti-sigma factor RsiW